MLEAGLVGVPSLVPDHGAFPERIRELGHGWTYPAGSPPALCQAMVESVNATDVQASEQLRRAVQNNFSMEVTGPKISRLMTSLID